jgi:hypothetical protein
MAKFFLHCTLILIIYCLNSCTKDDEIGCWKCTIKKPGSEKNRTVCDKTIQEASNQVLSEETGYGGGGNMKIHCERD